MESINFSLLPDEMKVEICQQADDSTLLKLMKTSAELRSLCRNVMEQRLEETLYAPMIVQYGRLEDIERYLTYLNEEIEKYSKYLNIVIDKFRQVGPNVFVVLSDGTQLSGSSVEEVDLLFSQHLQSPTVRARIFHYYELRNEKVNFLRSLWKRNPRLVRRIITREYQINYPYPLAEEQLTDILATEYGIFSAQS